MASRSGSPSLGREPRLSGRCGADHRSAPCRISASAWRPMRTMRSRSRRAIRSAITRIAWRSAFPEAGKDFAYGEAFPHEALMDMLGGVDFRKGCYVGQEVVSRMQHRGTARTRIVPVSFRGRRTAGGERGQGRRQGRRQHGLGAERARAGDVAARQGRRTRWQRARPSTAGRRPDAARPAWGPVAGRRPGEASATPHLGRDARS